MLLIKILKTIVCSFYQMSYYYYLIQNEKGIDNDRLRNNFLINLVKIVMMKYFKVIVLLLLIVSCAPIYVNYDYDKQTDFRKYKTYNYYSNLETGLSDLDTKRLLYVMDAKMKNMGFALTETPEFFINIQSIEFSNDQRNTVGVGVGGSSRNVVGGISIGLPIGQAKVNRQITIDFIDENGNGLFWQAVSESSFNPNASPEKREQRLKSIIEKNFSKYPPRGKN